VARHLRHLLFKFSYSARCLPVSTLLGNFHFSAHQQQEHPTLLTKFIKMCNGKIKRELIEFIDKIPDIKLEGFPDSKKKIWKDDNYRLVMQGVS
jgi:hypothetical protein